VFDIVTINNFYKKIRIRTHFLILIFISLLQYSCQTSEVNQPFQPYKVEIPVLLDSTFDFSSIQNYKATVFIFLSPECPLCISYTRTLKDLFKEFTDKNFNFYGVVPGKSFSRDSVYQFVYEYEIPFKMILDTALVLTQHYGARITPEIVVVDSTGNKIYQGRIDNWAFAPGKTRQTTTENDLKDFLKTLPNRQSAAMIKTEAIGCFIEEINE